MSNSCIIELNGIDTVLSNMKDFTRKLKIALLLDSKNIASNMEAWAKTNATWTDRTTHARNFLKATVKWENSNTLMIALSHGVDYGIWLELCNEGRYAILEKSIAEFLPEFASGWKELAKGVGVI